MLYTAFILGLLGSFHCIGMCGPIAFMLPVSRDNEVKKFLQILLYHFGRLLAYSLIGLTFGLIGKSLNLFGLQQHLSIGIGILMILVILLPSGRFQKFNLSQPLYRFIGRIKSSLGAALKKKSPDTFFTIGFLNGFLPCGLVYMAVFGAIAAGSIYTGSLYMLLFGLGTIPLMTTAVYFSSLLGGTMKRKIQKFIPVFVVLIGALFILRGLGLGIPYISPASIGHEITSSASCH
ncbi:sulfite exporter TauE/SafE family protein [Salinimicrobium xinjiangense]|uniref:sulfite exporter TauE/SafE family protein n=1 Tax=Salinimicrobium xinjiangense TaxID=438596 RepID=UPI0004911934|nr:sulfite exporter TauE/SafE family protein [Salinimicrobium xinjiangense]